MLLKRPGNILDILIHLNLCAGKALYQGFIYIHYVVALKAQHHALRVFGVHTNEQPRVRRIAYKHLHYKSQRNVHATLVSCVTACVLCYGNDTLFNRIQLQATAVYI